MRITIKAPGGKPFELADHGYTSPDNLRINGETMADTAEYLRAAAVEVFDRGNRRTSISFSVTRTHASLEAAELFILKHETTLPRRGLIEFEAHQGRGRAWLYDAVLTQASCSHKGVTSVHDYAILGGAVSSVNPNTLPQS